MKTSYGFLVQAYVRLSLGLVWPSFGIILVLGKALQMLHRSLMGGFGVKISLYGIFAGGERMKNSYGLL